MAPLTAQLEPISADAPELRLLAQFAGLAPARLAAGLNNPARMAEYMGEDETQRLNDALSKLQVLANRVTQAFADALALARSK